MRGLMWVPQWQTILAFTYQRKLDGKETYPLKISKKLGMTYAHVGKLLRLFQDSGWVVVENRLNDDRLRCICLTASGERIAERVHAMVLEHGEQGLGTGISEVQYGMLNSR